MKKWLMALGLFVVATAWAQGFLPAMDDVPMMEGLYSVEEIATFDNPSEKMVIISAQTDKAAKEVKNFYRQTLTNLGWSYLRENNYVRGSDSLTLELTPDSKVTNIQFTLVQKN